MEQVMVVVETPDPSTEGSLMIVRSSDTSTNEEEMVRSSATTIGSPFLQFKKESLLTPRDSPMSQRQLGLQTNSKICQLLSQADLEVSRSNQGESSDNRLSS
jgi:hypothetical protein